MGVGVGVGGVEVGVREGVGGWLSRGCRGVMDCRRSAVSRGI